MKKILIFTMLISLFSCNSELSEKEKLEYTVKGKEIAKATFDALSSQLMAKMKAGGPAEAVPFCNLKAAPITKQLSEKHNVVIKRASDKLRSCDNEPTERELEIINNYQNIVAEGKELKPILELDSTNAKHFYAPIIVKANCLVCHGKVNETMSVKTDSIIKLTYPFDIATGYNEGDVRGVWSIAFNK
ncbi:DUF3365 domain-containing protein [Lutibacter sp. A80]|uniref:Tll0287-like domain-containing protein n=1 Tax=Lutibacter sp. A80 TaxID=2918453 RepID=UPI001F06E9F2|nr:DUF3365 domain-containing protein [Lutibacter sp. A80]UMB60051.1 DUF3365 domain-containing protein [Lutibacter sp. A80]